MAYSSPNLEDVEAFHLALEEVGLGGEEGGVGRGGLGHHPVPLLRLLTPAVPCLVEPGLKSKINQDT